MLKFLRKKNIAKIIFWGLVILILPAFVLWGVGSVGRSKLKGPSYVGLIDNRKISFDELAKNMVSIRCQVILNYGAQPKVLDIFLKNKGFLAKLAWDRLLMLNEAGRHKIEAKDKDVVALIKSHPLFSRNGKFDDKIYQYILRYNIGIDPRAFEEIMRENLNIQRMNDIVTKDIKSTDEEVLNEYKKENEKFKLSYVLIAPLEESKGLREKIMGLTEKDGLTFENAASKLNLKILETPIFSRTDYLEGIGEAADIVDEAVRLKKDEVSKVVETRKGGLIFKVSEVQEFDKEKFEKEKDEFAKKILERKKPEFLETWLRRLENKAKLNIDLGDYEKYYR